jgi:hypothetical protein
MQPIMQSFQWPNLAYPRGFTGQTGFQPKAIVILTASGETPATFEILWRAISTSAWTLPPSDVPLGRVAIKRPYRSPSMDYAQGTRLKMIQKFQSRQNSARRVYPSSHNRGTGLTGCNQFKLNDL